jgi:hypothetical protein
MQSYGIAVREKTDGLAGLRAAERYRGMKLAAGAWVSGPDVLPAGASWGDAHQMRKVWLVDRWWIAVKTVQPPTPDTRAMVF